MVQNIQMRRGTNAARSSYTLLSGEPGWTTDTKVLFVGDGSTVGGIQVAMYSDITSINTSISNILNGTTNFTKLDVDEIVIDGKTISSTTDYIILDPANDILDCKCDLIPDISNTYKMGHYNATWSEGHFRKLGVGGITPVSQAHIYQNTSDTGTGAGLTIEQDGAGDCQIQWLLTGGQRYVAGIDNSDDGFKIGRGIGWATGEDIVIDTSGNVTINGNTTLETINSPEIKALLSEHDYQYCYDWSALPENSNHKWTLNNNVGPVTVSVSSGQLTINDTSTEHYLLYITQNSLISSKDIITFNVKIKLDSYTSGRGIAFCKICDGAKIAELRLTSTGLAYADSSGAEVYIDQTTSFSTAKKIDVIKDKDKTLYVFVEGVLKGAIDYSLFQSTGNNFIGIETYGSTISGITYDYFKYSILKEGSKITINTGSKTVGGNINVYNQAETSGIRISNTDITTTGTNQNLNFSPNGISNFSNNVSVSKSGALASIHLYSESGYSALSQYTQNSITKGQVGYSDGVSSVIVQNVVTDELLRLLDSGGALLNTNLSVSNNFKVDNTNSPTTYMLKLTANGSTGPIIDLIPSSSSINPSGWGWYAGSTTSDIGDGNLGAYDYGNTSAEFAILPAGGGTKTRGILPWIDDTYDNGSASLRWNDIYATNTTIQTSDETLKENITSLDENTCKQFVNLLDPVSYKWKDYYEAEVTESYDIEEIEYQDVIVEEVVEEIVDNKLVRSVINKTIKEPVMISLPVYDENNNPIMTIDPETQEEVQVYKSVPKKITVTKTRTITPEKNKTFTRSHYGFTAQQLKSVMDQLNISSTDCAAYIDSNGQLGIRSLELLPILWKEVQRLQDEVELLKTT